jgi:hypothetical protein
MQPEGLLCNAYFQRSLTAGRVEDFYSSDY